MFFRVPRCCILHPGKFSFSLSPVYQNSRVIALKSAASLPVIEHHSRLPHLCGVAGAERGQVVANGQQIGEATDDGERPDNEKQNVD